MTIRLPSRCDHPWLRCIGCLSLLCGCVLATADEPSSDPTTIANERRVDIAELIEQLGHPSYAVRVRTRETLERIGLQAFDDLHNAQYRSDSEIAMAARYLIGSLLVSWSDESDPPAVREALDEYGAQSESERHNRIDRLAELPGRQGVAALSRLVRFETSLRLSRDAALAIMRGAPPSDRAARLAEADTIVGVLGANPRQASQWLRVYADELREGRYLATAWDTLVAEQRRAIDEAGDVNATRPIVLELVRVSASRAVLLGEADAAFELAAAHLDLIPPVTIEVTNACGWAIDQGLHPLVLRLREKHPAMFGRNPILLYAAAEAVLAGDEGIEAAEAIAEEAAAIESIPRHDSPEAAAMSPKLIEERAQRHREIGAELESRGLFRWAEREYRNIIDALPLDSALAAHARRQLARLLSELLRHRDVVELLEPMIQRSEEDQQYARRLQTQHIDLSRLKSAMWFQRGLAQAASEDADERAAAGQTLLTALELEPDNVDILIAMYRLDGDELWQADVRRRIRSIATMFDNQIEAMKLQLQARIRFPDLLYRLAEAYNQYAWLISNTEGDQEKALSYSLRSLELVPDQPAQLDTLGRCYFAVGDLENAIRVQRRAVKQMPYSPPLLRQLAEFEAAAAAAD